MRIFPLALITVGALGVAKHLGFIPPDMFPVIGPVLLIALGVALLVRGPRRCHGGWHGRRDAVNHLGGSQPPSSGAA